MASRQTSEEIKQDLKNTYTAIAEHFDVTRHRPWPETQIFAAMIEKGRVLDLGCGNGRNAIYLAKKGFEVIGLDNVEKLLEIAEKNAEREGVAKQVKFVESSLPKIPLDDEAVDAVLYIAALHHLPTSAERRTSIEEVYRVLKRGGQALISVWASEQDKFKSDFSKHAVPGMEKGDVSLPWKRQVDAKIFYRYYHFFNKEEFLTLFDNSRLEIIEYFYHADNHYVRARKQ